MPLSLIAAPESVSPPPGGPWPSIVAAIAATLGIIVVTFRDWLKGESEKHVAPRADELRERLATILDVISDHAAVEADRASRFTDAQQALRELTEEVRNTSNGLLKTADQLLLAVTATKEIILVVKYIVEHPPQNERTKS